MGEAFFNLKQLKVHLLHLIVYFYYIGQDLFEPLQIFGKSRRIVFPTDIHSVFTN